MHTHTHGSSAAAHIHSADTLVASPATVSLLSPLRPPSDHHGLSIFLKRQLHDLKTELYYFFFGRDAIPQVIEAGDIAQTWLADDVGERTGKPSPQQRVQPPGAPTSVKKGQPQHGASGESWLPWAVITTNPEGTEASREEGRRAARGTTSRDACTHTSASARAQATTTTMETTTANQTATKKPR
jgi:hypothetical protein